MEANLVFINSEVITVDASFSIKEAAAVKGNKIVAVGSNEEIKSWIGRKTVVVDLKGKSLLPGFIDAHLHIQWYGLTKLSTDLKDCSSILDMISLLKKSASATPVGNWIRGWGYNDNTVKERRLPTRWELDEISTEHPIYIQRSCGHVAVANSMALELAKINKDSVDPSGGEIERENGVPNGVLKESARMFIEEIDTYTDEEIINGINLAANDFIEAGITSIHDMGGKNEKHMVLLQKAAKNKDFKLRMYATIVSFDNKPTVIETALSAGMLTRLGDEKFRIGPCKVFLDGSITGNTAAVSQGYENDPENKGITYLDQNTLNGIMEKAHQLGCQITAHAIGDTAVKMMIDCIEHSIQLNNSADHRHRIEHASICPQELIQRIKDLHIVIVTNPAFFYDYGDEYIPNIGQRINHMFPIRSFLDQGVVVAAGSDCPITGYNPLIGIHGIVNRTSKHGTLIGFGQTATLPEAIRMFTWNGAFASFEEGIKGSLEVGKLADLVVLDQSIMKSPLEKIKDIQVEMTVIGGEIVYPALTGQ